MLSPAYSASQAEMEQFLNAIVLELYARAKGTHRDTLALPIFDDVGSAYQILSEPAKFSKNMGLIRTLGESRFTANGEDWRQRRDITQRHYLSAGSANQSSDVAAAYEAHLARSDATSESIHRALMRASSEVFFRSLGFSVDVEPLLEFFDQARPYVKRLQYYCWKPPSESDVSRLSDEGRALLNDFANQASESAALRALITAFEQRAKGMERFNPLEELLMNFFAGIETTAATLGFAIDRLGLDPRVQKRLHDEILAGDRDTYLNCFVQETLRYFPAIPFVTREVTSDASLNDIALTKGQIIALSIVGLHHNPDYWNEPELFHFSRPEFLDDSYNRRAFLPFSAGPRMCGGAKLARMEITEGLKAVVRQFEIDGATEEIGFDYGLALRPQSLAEVNFTRRHRH